MTKVYVVTPNFGINFLPKYFESLYSQTYADFKLVFVDNTLDQSAINYVNKNCKSFLKQMIVIKNEQNNSFTKTTNQGIYEAMKDKECKYIISLNNDVILDKNFIKELVDCAEKHPTAGSIQSLMLWGDTGLIDNVGLEFSKNGMGFAKGGYEKYSPKKYNREEEILGCCAGACLYSTKALKKIEFKNNTKQIFDDRFGAYYDDFDVAFRLQWAGFKAFYAPKAIVRHFKNVNQTNQKIYFTTRNYTLNWYKNLSAKFIWTHLHLILITELIQIVYNIVKLKFIVLKAKFHAYWTIINMPKLFKKQVDFKQIEKWFILKWKV